MTNVWLERTVPTVKSEAPSATSSFATIPSSRTSKSTVALSVSTCAIVSPARMESPSFLSQAAMLPCVIVGESAGIVSTV